MSAIPKAKRILWYTFVALLAEKGMHLRSAQNMGLKNSTVNANN